MAGVVCGGKESRKREIERKSQTVMKTLSLLDSIRLLVARFNCYRVIRKVEIQASRKRFRKRANAIAFFKRSASLSYSGTRTHLAK